MRDLILVRHGEAEHNVKGWTGGWTDTPLTPLGRRQAKLTGKHLKDLLGNATIALFSSDLLRASETALIIGSILEVPPIVEKALRDINWGIAVNMPLEEARKLELEKTEPLLDWVPFPKGESWRMLHHRVVPFLEKIHAQESGTVMIVTHANVLEECIQWWLEQPLEMRRKIAFDTAFCSITHLSTNDWQQRTVGFINNTAHLQSLSQDM
ncbi:MAG: histidine phosphatase family protein [Promethearchaeota archaeon]